MTLETACFAHWGQLWYPFWTQTLQMRWDLRDPSHCSIHLVLSQWITWDLKRAVTGRSWNSRLITLMEIGLWKKTIAFWEISSLEKVRQHWSLKYLACWNQKMSSYYQTLIPYQMLDSSICSSESTWECWPFFWQVWEVLVENLFPRGQN